MIESQRSISHICFIGAGYVGGPTAAVLARECPHVQVTVVDRNAERIKAWKSDVLPVSEPSLLDVVRGPRDGLNAEKRRNLHFTTDLEGSIQAADTIMVAVDTPTKSRGTGAGYSLDIGRLEEVAMSIAQYATSDKIVVEKSTVPVGTGHTISNILMDNSRVGVNFEVLSNPEFLAEGTAICDLLSPDRVLIGSSDTKSGLSAAQALADVYATWVPRSRIITINLFSSELSKLAANAMLAQRVSSANALSLVCEATGANIDQVMHAVGSDSRIGPHMLRSSFGFGGSCFKKDILSLVYLCKSLHLDDVASYWQSISDINETQKSRAVSRIVSRFNNSMGGKKVAVLGFAFKEGTGDTRESCSIDLVKGLLHEGALVNIYDPYVDKSQILKDLGFGEESSGGSVKICQSGEEACEHTVAVLVATNWDMFRVNPKALMNGVKSSYDDTNGEKEASSKARGVPYGNGSTSCSATGPLYASNGIDSTTEIMTDNCVSINSLENSSESNGSSMETLEDNPTPISTPELDPVRYNEPSTGPRLNGINDGDIPPVSLDWAHVAKAMKYPRIVFGSSRCLDRDVLVSMGFDVELIGRNKRKRN
ncbi:hypothetical protein JX265_005360 [Neoarthrinium moseri]|uniref:UDP-glucose 6-dehydrogenase n=1 Tax=Neoarthrinium moseri TaxID=1658444 RepID=A0A9Q0AR85_9PEZI|nr:hypothetical protein JX265_005360 [Neoarthrinium moseri]